MYKIQIKKTSIGYKLVLLKKFWFFYVLDTVCNIAYGYEYLVNKQINEWIYNFNLPIESVEQI